MKDNLKYYEVAYDHNNIKHRGVIKVVSMKSKDDILEEYNKLGVYGYKNIKVYQVNEKRRAKISWTKGNVNSNVWNYK